MDWMGTNNSTLSQWSDRQHPDMHSFTPQEGDLFDGGGMPVEYMVALANETDSDAWFTMPHLATDDYVTRFAEYVRDNLDPDLNVYIEYSNEVWNGQFEQAHYAREQGQQLTHYDADQYAKGFDWYSKRTTEVTQIWDDVYGAEKDRVIGVLGAQAGNPWQGQRVADYHWEQDGVNLSHEDYGIDAIAIAPYFGGYLGSPEYENQVQNWNVDQLFDELNNNALPRAYGFMQDYANIAQQEGLELLAYEGGQHLAGHGGVQNNDAITDLFIQANRDPRMGDLYREYFQEWHNIGGGLFMNFNDISSTSKFGNWGALEHLYQDSSPKWDALQSFLN